MLRMILYDRLSRNADAHKYRTRILVISAQTTGALRVGKKVLRITKQDERSGRVDSEGYR
jgi:hypothetical protein